LFRQSCASKFTNIICSIASSQNPFNSIFITEKLIGWNLSWFQVQRLSLRDTQYLLTLPGFEILVGKPSGFSFVI